MRLIVLLILFSLSMSFSQSVHWKPKKASQPNLHLFHSTDALALPTAETMKKGDWEFEISHHFIPPVAKGENVFFGLDGPVNNRIALGYAPSSRLVVTLARSNAEKHYDLWAKYRFLQLRNTFLPTLMALRIGGGWNSRVQGRSKNNPHNFQYYGQIIVNALWHKKVGMGVVGSFLYNSAIYESDFKTSLLTGFYLQYYLSNMVSILAEWNPTLSGWRDSYDSFSFGVELETGGHFFKIFLTNNDLLQPAQYLKGANLPIAWKSMRLAFMITRVL